MESPSSPNFDALDPFLPSFLQIPGSLRDAVDPAPSPRRVDTVHRARNDVAPPKLRLNVQSSPRKQTARRLASSRAQEEQDVAKMPEIAAAVLPKHLNFLFEAERKGTSCTEGVEALGARDFFQRDELQEKMQSLSLSDHFDSFGKARFQRLGLAFAAKQMMPHQMAKYSSVSDKPMTPRKGDKSAKAFIMSQEALSEDNKRWMEHTKTILDAIQESDRHKDEDVKDRQVAILFAELPKFLHLLPSSVPQSSLELELNREEDPQQRWLSLRQNSLLRQPVASWRFRRNEVLMLLQVLKAWTLSSWPKGGAEMGMDRSSFCRFILDVGLVDQHKVPYFWAVHLFDSLAKQMRFCAVDDQMLSSAPLLPVVSWWDLFPIVEHLAGQHFKIAQSNLRVKFIDHLAEIARLRLPSFAQKAMNISKEHLELMHQDIDKQVLESPQCYFAIRIYLNKCPSVPKMFQLTVAMPSGRSEKLVVPKSSAVGDLKLLAQKTFGQGFLRLVADGRILDPMESLETAGLQDGDELCALALPFHLAATRKGHLIIFVGGAFCLWCCDRLVTWGDRPNGGDSSAVQDQLRNVQKVRGTARAFAALLENGQVVTWGDPERGGNSPTLRNVQQLQATLEAFAAILADGSVVTWGNEDCGGDSSLVQNQLLNVQQVEASGGAFAALRGDGSVITWGDGFRGANSSRIQDQLRNVQQIRATTWAFAAILKNGSVITWGDPESGGDSSAVQDQLRNVQEIYGSGRAFAAILTNGSVVAWGSPANGGDTSGVHDQLHSVHHIQATANAFAAILADGSVVTWGHPESGGDSSGVQDQLRKVQQIESTQRAFAAVRENGSVVTWGSAHFGGDSSKVQDKLRNVKQVQGTDCAFAAVLVDGSVWVLMMNRRPSRRTDETGKRTITKSRSLRAQNEKASSKVQLHILEDAAKQRQKSLLVEPEVLQLLWQHEEVFKALHKAYADDRGHMSFAAVVQLCSDFSLAPKLISLHALRKIYESLEALDIDIDDIRDFEGEGDMMKAKSLNPSRGSRQAMRRSSIQQLSGEKKAPASPSPSNSLSGRRSSLSVNTNKKRATLHAVEKKRFVASPAPGEKSIASSPVSSASLKRRGSLQASFGTTQERSGLLLPWEVISMRLREGAKNEPCSAFLRAPALMELLCKVAFSYLGCYGNMQQRSMSTLMQSVWLLVYMRFTVESVRGSLHRRSSLLEGEDHYGALGRAARRLHPEVWKIKAAPDFQDQMPAACVKPVPREVLRQTTKQASEAPQEGVPYVVDKRCRICRSDVEVASWGNVRCFGCSKVDSLAFRRHPLVSVLRKSGEKPVALAGKVPRVRNTSLSPVRFQDNDTLRPADTDPPCEDEDFEVVAGLSRTSSLREGSFAPSSQS
eukprot:s2206_g4.t1